LLQACRGAYGARPDETKGNEQKRNGCSHANVTCWIHRLLDPENTSVILATLNRAARSLGRRVKIELVPAERILFAAL